MSCPFSYRKITDSLQFLKFQAFAEQLTKETQDLKVKIENHKREHRRLSALIEQQKDDSARLTTRLSSTEKQRDDALEALVLQQEIAEELERDRKRNKKELSALQHTNTTLLRQRDESQRVVVHLRALIDGQTHHMEHIIRSLGKAPELNAVIGEGFEDASEDAEDGGSKETSTTVSPTERLPAITETSRTPSRLSRRESRNVISPDRERNTYSSLSHGRPSSRLSITDSADRHLRDKTDAIADIIRNISEQCAAAVEGLQLAHEAEDHEVPSEEQIDPSLLKKSGKGRKVTPARGLTIPEARKVESSDLSDDRHETDSGHGGSTGHLTPTHERDSSDPTSADRSESRTSSIIPPTPDLVGGRSSTSMSGYSSTAGSGVAGRDSLPAPAKEDSSRTKIVGVDTHPDGGDSSCSDTDGPNHTVIDDVVGGKKSAVDVVGMRRGVNA